MMKNEIIEKYKLAGKIRFVSFSLFGVFLLGMKAMGGYSYINPALAALIIAEVFFNQPYGFILKNVNLRRFQYYQMATDIICITWVTYYLGGEEVPFMALSYSAVILWAGAVSTLGAVFFAVSLSSLFFAFVIIAENTGLLPQVCYYGHEMSLAQVTGIVAGNVAFFFAFGYFSALSSRIVRKAEKEKYESAVKYTHKFRATSHLVGYTTHDAVNHLANISGYAMLLLNDKRIKDESSGMLRSICELSSKSTELLARLMKFSRNEEGEIENIDINGVIEEAMGLTGPLTRYSSITYKMELTRDLPRIYGEKTRLQEVFTALILNSYEAVKGKGFIAIRTFLSSEGDKICIMFSDSGGGMSEDDIAKVKTGEPFLKESGSEKKVALGLVTARAIIDKHSGKMDIQSAQGEGTSVFIELPIISEGGLDESSESTDS